MLLLWLMFLRCFKVDINDKSSKGILGIYILFIEIYYYIVTHDVI